MYDAFRITNNILMYYKCYNVTSYYTSFVSSEKESRVIWMIIIREV